MNILRMIKNMVKVAKLLSTDDTGDLQFLTVSMLGKEQKVLSLKPYGLMSNPPADSMVTVVSQQGQESNGIGIADDPKNRTLKNLVEGEVAIGNYETGDYVVFKDGNIVEIQAGASLTATAPITNVVATTSTTVTSPSVNVTAATNVAINTPAFYMASQVNTFMSMTVAGSITLKSSSTMFIQSPDITIGQAGGIVRKLGTWV